MKPRAIDRRLEAKRLQWVRRRVYRVGPIRQPFEAEMAAILAVGASAVLSHHSAASLHQLPHPAGDGLVHLTVIDSEPGRKPGVRIHRTTRLADDEITRREGIPHILIARYPRRPGAPAIRNLLQGTPQFTRSKSQRRLLDALRRAGFEVESNVQLVGYEADLYLPSSGRSR
jgi:hypothetical protein